MSQALAVAVVVAVAWVGVPNSWVGRRLCRSRAGGVEGALEGLEREGWIAGSCWAGFEVGRCGWVVAGGIRRGRGLVRVGLVVAPGFV